MSNSVRANKLYRLIKYTFFIKEPQDVYETTLKVTCESGHLLEPYLDIKSNKLKIARRLSSKVRQFYGLPDGWEQVSGEYKRLTMMQELRLTKFKLTFIGRSGSNRSVFYLYGK